MLSKLLNKLDVRDLYTKELIKFISDLHDEEYYKLMSNKEKQLDLFEQDNNQVDFENYAVPRTSIDDATPEEWNSAYKELFKRKQEERMFQGSSRGYADIEDRGYFKAAEDDNVNKVVHSYLTRADEGMRKYGQTTSQNPLEFVQWLRHLQEELMDATIYIERAIEELNK